MFCNQEFESRNVLALCANLVYNHQRFRSVCSAVQSGLSLCEQRPLSARQRNNIQMVFPWQADSGPTPCVGWTKTGIRLCSLELSFLSGPLSARQQNDTKMPFTGRRIVARHGVLAG